MSGTGTRRRARECALQVLYALDTRSVLGDAHPLEPAELDEALKQFWLGFQEPMTSATEEERDGSVVEFAELLIRGTVNHISEIDRTIQSASKNWRLERMARVDRNILRLGTFELQYHVEVPAKVVINEAIEVAKRFGTGESAAFVNGLLDRISQELVTTCT